MAAVGFSIYGAIFINWPPPMEKFNSDHFHEQILGQFLISCRFSNTDKAL
jgi:hypothetical protein